MEHYSLKEKNGLIYKYICTFDRSHVDGLITQELEKKQKIVAIKGYRVGHAPIDMIRQAYYSDVFQQVLNGVINENVDKIVKENNFSLAVIPAIEFLNEATTRETNTFEFEVKLEVMPSINEIDFSKISLQSYNIVLSDEDIKKEVDLIASRTVSFDETDAQYEARRGDSISMDFVGRIDGEEFEGGAANDYDIVLGSGTFIPGFEDQLVGAKSGTNVIVTVPFPADYHVENLAGKEAQFFCTIKQIKKSSEPLVGDELAKKMNFESYDLMKSDVIQKVQSYYKNTHKDSLKNTLFNQISTLLDFDVPPSIFEKVLEDQKKRDETSSDDVITKKALENTRLSYFLSYMSEKNEIKVTEQDFVQFLTQSASYSGVNPFALLNFYNQNKDARKNIEALIRENKLYDIIFQKVNISYSDLPKEAFDKILAKQIS